MFVRRHSQATTTPNIPAAIQARDEPALVLAERHRTTEQTVWKWCEFQNLTMSCSGLDPCLRRRGAGRLRDRKAKDDPPQHNGLKASAPGYIHIVVKYPLHMANGTSRRYLFVALDRAIQWVFIAMYRNKTAANAGRFLGDLERACPIRIRTI